MRKDPNCSLIVLLLLVTTLFCLRGAYSGSGSGSGATLAPDCGSGGTGDVCPRPPIMCLPPEPLADRPSETGDEALQKAICYVNCIGRYYPLFPSNEMVWNIIGRSQLSINCIHYRQLLECSRGCAMKLNEPESCSTTCVSQCEDLGNVEGGACGLDCNQTRCEDGCSFEKPAVNNYPEAQDPVAAPRLMPLETTDGQLSGRYMVDITDSIPETGTRLGLSTLVLRVEDVEAPGTYTYYPLETLEDEVNLKAFACKTVNISFSVATRDRGFSGYSLPQSVVVDVDFPDQLTTFTVEFVPDERPGYFRQHIAQISFDTSELEGFELVTGYTVIIRSLTSRCALGDVFHYFPDHSDANNLTIYSSDRQQFFDNCLFSITVQVDPWNGDDGRANQPFIVVPNWLMELGLVNLPEDAISTNSTSEYDIYIEKYRTNITWTLNTAILPPAFITAIDNFRGLGTEICDRTRPGSIPDILGDGCTHDESQCVPAEDGRLTYSAIRTYIPETDRDILDLYYRIPMLIIFQQNYTEPTNSVPTFDHSFDAIEIAAPIPIVVGVTEYQDHVIEVLSSGEVAVTAFITWPFLVVPFGHPRKFLVYFGRERLPQNARQQEVHEVPLASDVTSYQEEIQEIFDTSEGINFTTNLQVRVVVTADSSPNSPELDRLLFFWSEPVIIQVVIPEEPNPITSINVTLVNQRLDIDEEGTIVAVVELNVTWSRPLLRVGTLESYDLYAGLQGLTPREQLDDMQLRNNISASETSTAHVFTLPLDTRLDFEDTRLDFDLYLQMRGINEFGDGNWSESVVTQVTIEDPPQPSVVTEIEVELFELSRVLADDKEQEVLTVTVNATWFPPNVINGTLTVYEAYLGEVPLGPLEDPANPMDLIVIEANSTDGLITFTFIISSPVNLFFQMRASNGFIAGSWSEATEVSIPEPPKPSVMTEIEVKDFKINIVETRKRAVDRVEVIVDAVWSPPNVTNGNLTGFDAHIGLQPLEPRDDPEDLKLTQFEAVEENGTVNVNFTTENPSFLYFQMRARNEFIAGDWSEAKLLPVDPNIETGGSSSDDDDLAAILGGTLPIVIIILIAVTVLLVIMISYLGKKFYTRHKIANLFDQHDDEGIAMGPIRHETFHLPPMLTAEKAPLLDQWEVPANEVIVDKQLGEGAFGEVYKGVIKGPLRNPKISLLLKQSIGIPVAIKLLKTTASGKEKADFLGEIEMMKKIAEGYNAHIVNMVGCVTLQEPLCLITEFVPHGDLLSYIRANRKKANKKRRREKLLQQQQAEAGENVAAPYLDPQGAYSQLDPKKVDLYAEDEEDEEPYHELGELTATDLIQFAYQIATGMEYLASLNIVHRDLACRNILIGDDKKLKITDFGMSREVEEVYVKKTKGRLPLKWMAIECIIAREFTTSSDVWAYGVVLWEIGTLGGFPYPTVPNQDLLNMLKQGHRLEKPENCAPEVYQIMLECWNEDPQDRPTFSGLREKFSNLILAGHEAGMYIDLQVDEMKPYYMIKEDEDEEERGSRKSVSSLEGSESSFELNKKGKQKEVIKKKSTNPYVDQPSRLQAAAPPVENQPPMLRETEIEECPYADQPAYRPTPEEPTLMPAPEEPTLRPTPDEPTLRPTPGELELPDSPSTPPEELSLGIPLDMLVDNAGQQLHPGIERRTTNPYVDDPSTSLSTHVIKENGDTPAQKEIVAIAEVFENPSPFSPPPMSPPLVEDQEGAVLLTDTVA